jgi:hypothetical protein
MNGNIAVSPHPLPLSIRGKGKIETGVIIKKCGVFITLWNVFGYF